MPMFLPAAMFADVETRAALNRPFVCRSASNACSCSLEIKSSSVGSTLVNKWMDIPVSVAALAMLSMTSARVNVVQKITAATRAFAVFPR
jgi:hypothetical protein